MPLALADTRLATRANPILNPVQAATGGGVAAAEREMKSRPHVGAERRTVVSHREVIRDGRRATTAAEAVGDLPRADEAVHVLITGRFALWDCVPAALAQVEEPAALTVATLGFSKRNVEAMGKLLDAGRVSRLRLLCSHYFAGTSPDIYRFAADEIARRAPAAEFLSVRTHCKLVLIRFAGGRTVTMESSANLRSCKNLEQLTLFGSPAVHAFHAGWIDELFREGANFVNCYTGARRRPAG